MIQTKVQQEVRQHFRIFNDNLFRVLKKDPEGYREKMQKLLLDFELDILTTAEGRGMAIENGYHHNGDKFLNIPKEISKLEMQLEDLGIKLEEKQAEVDTLQRNCEVERKNAETYANELSKKIADKEREYEETISSLQKESKDHANALEFFEKRYKETSRSLQRATDLVHNNEYAMKGINEIVDTFEPLEASRSDPCYSLFNSIYKLFRAFHEITDQHTIKSDIKIMSSRKGLMGAIVGLRKEMQTFTKSLKKSATFTSLTLETRLKYLHDFLKGFVQHPESTSLKERLSGVHNEKDQIFAQNLVEYIEKHENVQKEYINKLEQTREKHKKDKRMIKLDLTSRVTEIKEDFQEIAEIVGMFVQEVSNVIEDRKMLKVIFENVIVQKENLQQIVKQQESQLEEYNKDILRGKEKYTQLHANLYKDFAKMADFETTITEIKQKLKEKETDYANKSMELEDAMSRLECFKHIQHKVYKLLDEVKEKGEKSETIIEVCRKLEDICGEMPKAG